MSKMRIWVKFAPWFASVSREKRANCLRWIIFSLKWAKDTNVNRRSVPSQKRLICKLWVILYLAKPTYFTRRVTFSQRWTINFASVSLAERANSLRWVTFSLKYKLSVWSGSRATRTNDLSWVIFSLKVKLLVATFPFCEQSKQTLGFAPKKVDL